MKKINFGLVGYKFMGRAHSNALARIPMFFDPELTPVRAVLCGRDREWAEEAAGKFGFPEVETDWTKLVKRPDIDAIDITAPSDCHKDIAIEAARNGKHVFCEKPLALNLADAREIVAEVKKADVRNQIGFNYRFAPALRLAKRLIDSGRLGKVYHFRGVYLQEYLVDPSFPKVWRLDKAVAGSGSLGDLGAHVVDQARWLVGEFGRVAAMQKTFIKERPAAARMTGLSASGGGSGETENVDVDDATAFLIEFENGAFGTIEATRFAQGHSNGLSFEINGEYGSLKYELERVNELQFFDAREGADSAGWRVIQATYGGHPYMEHWWPPGHVLGYEHTFVHELYEFIECVARGEECAPSFIDGMKCSQILEAVEISARESAYVDVSKI